MRLEMYSFEDSHGVEQSFTTRDIEEAKTYARKYKLRLIANIYEWSETELVEDHTGGDEQEEYRDANA